jgi:hypothetical protein
MHFPDHTQPIQDHNRHDNMLSELSLNYNNCIDLYIDLPPMMILPLILNRMDRNKYYELPQVEYMVLVPSTWTIAILDCRAHL